MSSLADGRVLITGAGGFLGSHCLTALLGEATDIHAVNRAGQGPHGPRVVWHAADLRDREAAAALIEKIRPTHVLHAAWIAVPGRYATDPENLAWLDAGIAMLNAFRRNGGLRFLGVGTCFEYDWSAPNFDEDHTPIHPSTLYGRAKAAMCAATHATATGAFDDVWLRVFLPYGPGDNLKRLIPSVMQKLLAGEPIDLGSGSGLRDFIWAPDIADLAVTLLKSNETGIFNAGTGIGTSIREVAEYIGARLGRSELLRFGLRPDPIGEPASLVADVVKARDRLGWSAPTPLRAGLDMLLETG